MDKAEHIALAQTYLAASVRLEVDGVHQLAAEAVWGAASLAIEAGRHARGLRHGNTDDKRRFIQRMDVDVVGGLAQWDSGLKIVRDELHHHFYTNRLSADEAAESLALGRAFVEQLIRIAQAQGDEAGRL